MKVIVSRLEQYPENEPTGWAVGFNVTLENGRSFYTDTVISFDKAGDDEAAVKKAKTALKSQINKQATALGKKSSLVGTEVKL